MLTGTLPHRGSIGVVMAAIQSQEPPRPRELCPEVDAALEAICLKMMAKRAEGHYDSMREAADALAGFLTREASPATPQRRGTLLRVVGSLALSLLLIGAIVLVIVTRHGTVRFEIKDDHVRLLLDGERFTVEDTRTMKRMSPGKHTFSVEVGGQSVPLGSAFTLDTVQHQGEYKLATSIDGVAITAGRFDVSQGKQHILRVELVPVDQRQAAARPPSSNNSDSPAEAHLSTPRPPPRASLLDHLRRADISQEQLIAAGLGDAANAPKQVVAIYGDSRWMHWNKIHFAAVEFNLDGRRIASGSWDGTVVLWDVDTGRGEMFASEVGGTTALTWHPRDQGKLFVGTWNGRVFVVDIGSKVWQPLATEEEESYDWDEGYVHALACSPDAALLVWAGSHRSFWYSPAEGKLVRHVPHRDIRSNAISGDGTLVATAGGDSVIRVWSSASGEKVGEFHGDRRELYNAIEFSPDGKHVVVGLCNHGTRHRGLVRFWDLKSDLWGRVLESPGGFAWSVKLNSDGRWLAEGRETGEVHLWDTKTWQRARTLSTTSYRTLVENGKRTVAFDPHGLLLASGGADHAVHVWDLANYRAVGEPTFGRLHSVALSPGGDLVVAAGDKGRLGLWGLRDNESRERSAHDGPVRCVAFAPRGEILATAGDDGIVQFWDVESGGEASFPPLRWKLNTSIMEAAFHPHDPVIALAATDGAVSVWNWTTGAPYFTIPERYPGEAFAVGFDANGNRLVTGGAERRAGSQTGMLHIRNAADGASVHKIAFADPVRALACHPTEDQVAVVSMASPYLDKTLFEDQSRCSLTLVDANTGQRLFALNVPVRNVSFSHDGDRLVLAGIDGKVRILNLRTHEIEEIQIGPSGGIISQALFSRDDRHIITANQNGTVYVLRL